MTEHPAKTLARLLEQASSDDRQAITGWLLEGQAANPRRGQARQEHQFRTVISDRPLRALSPGEDSQLVTVRLPQDLHAQLRDWCGEHGFSMAAVIRGLVERFLSNEGRPAVAEESGTEPPA